MYADFIYPEYEVVRNYRNAASPAVHVSASAPTRCTAMTPMNNMMMADDSEMRQLPQVRDACAPPGR